MMKERSHELGSLGLRENMSATIYSSKTVSSPWSNSYDEPSEQQDSVDSSALLLYNVEVQVCNRKPTDFSFFNPKRIFFTRGHFTIRFSLLPQAQSDSTSCRGERNMTLTSTPYQTLPKFEDMIRVIRTRTIMTGLIILPDLKQIVGKIHQTEINGF